MTPSTVKVKSNIITLLVPPHSTAMNIGYSGPGHNFVVMIQEKTANGSDLYRVTDSVKSEDFSYLSPGFPARFIITMIIRTHINKSIE
jgi:hypothetical protein